MNYAETNKLLNNLRQQNEGVFRMAISHIMSVGMKTMHDEETYRIAYAQISAQEDDSNSLLSKEIKLDIIKMAHQIAQVSHTDLLHYLSRNVEFMADDDSLSYDELNILVESNLYYIEMCCNENIVDTIDVARGVGYPLRYLWDNLDEEYKPYIEKINEEEGEF